MLVEELLWLNGEEELRISEVQGVYVSANGRGDSSKEKRAQKLVLRKVPGELSLGLKASNFGLEAVIPKKVNIVLQNSFSSGYGTIE